MLNQFKNLSCYAEFEIRCTLNCISKIDVLKEIGHEVGNYYFFVSDDGIFNWFDLNGNHIEDPGILKELYNEYIPCGISKFIIPDSVIYIGDGAFYNYESLKEITIPNGIISIGCMAFLSCKSLEKIVIPNSITIIGGNAFLYCDSLKEVIFKGKTLEEIKQMDNYPFGIKDESIIKCELC